MPAGLRLDWFSLQATQSFSPFVGLSTYGAAPALVAVAEPTPPADPTGEPAEPAVADAEPGEPDDVEANGGHGGPAIPPAADPDDGQADAYEPHVAPPSTRPDPVQPPPPVEPVRTTSTDPGTGRVHLPPAQLLTPEQAAQQRTSAQGTTPREPVKPPPEPVKPPPEPVKPPPEPVKPPPEPVKPPPVEPPPVAMATVQEVDNSCDDLVSLEPAALMGQLTSGQRDCLEARIVATSRMTEKDKISRVLIMDAETKGDKATWEKLMKRHLEDIDRSDPDLCFKYAIFLSRKGVGRAQGVIRWADYALENKAKWQGSTFVSRVNSLLKLKAEAANNIWQSAEEAYVQDRSDAKEAETTKYRDLTKVYAREWLDYARASGQDIKNAMALCVSASGNRQYCEGG
jgi:hypothetical protein